MYILLIVATYLFEFHLSLLVSESVGSIFKK